MRDAIWDMYLNFDEDEFRCKCGCGRADMDHDFMMKLQTWRNLLGFGAHVNSGFRCEEHNAAVGGGPAHVLGVAADIRIAGTRAHFGLKLATTVGFPGIGVSQKGSYGSRFLHLDTWDDPDLRPWLWSY